MKIAVKDLKPNPFRQIDSYPIDRAKVEQLKTSIEKLTFWDNILVRKNCQGYEIAYGHHRWFALKELGIKEIDIPVRDLDDATMLKVMAEENLNWTVAPAVLVQTVDATKKFLDAELAKYDTWAEIRLAQTGQAILGVDSGQAFAALKGAGVGWGTILQFLGSNWSRRKIKTALNILADKQISTQAVKIIPSMRQAEIFHQEVKKHEIPKPTQKKIAKQIAKEEVGYRQIPDLVAEYSTVPVKKIRKTKEVPNLIEFLNKREAEIDKLNYHLTALKPELKELVKNPRVLGRLVSTLKRLDKTMKTIITEYETQKMRKESEICV